MARCGNTGWFCIFREGIVDVELVGGDGNAQPLAVVVGEEDVSRLKVLACHPFGKLLKAQAHRAPPFECLGTGRPRLGLGLGFRV